MREHPILFSGPMVRAVLHGKKSVTRRICKPQPDLVNKTALGYRREWGLKMQCPYGEVGDKLWVRETWRPDIDAESGAAGIAYRADALWEEVECDEYLLKLMRNSDNWRPSIHMPRRYSRLLLTVTDVRVQQIQDMNAADAGREGFSFGSTGYRKFMEFWDLLNGDRGFGWATNPWVWVVDFEVAE